MVSFRAWASDLLLSREASDLGLFGTVANKGSYVEIHAQGSEKGCGGLAKKPLKAVPLSVR